MFIFLSVIFFGDSCDFSGLGSGVLSLIGVEVTIEGSESSGFGVVSLIGVEITIAGVRFLFRDLFLRSILFDAFLGVSSKVSISVLTFF